MPPLSPALVIAAATSFVGLGEEGDNRGQMVELFLREVGQPAGQPWCAAFVYHVGYWAHYDHAAARSSWPLPATASCWVLADFARRHKLLASEPQVGDVFLLYFPTLKRYAHTGIVVGVDQAIGSGGDAVYVCTTVEGNTNYEGARDGRLTLQKTRRFSVKNGDRFIRWTAARSEAEAA